LPRLETIKTIRDLEDFTARRRRFLYHVTERVTEFFSFPREGGGLPFFSLRAPPMPPQGSTLIQALDGGEAALPGEGKMIKN
jgi:hypothetical protein